MCYYDFMDKDIIRSAYEKVGNYTAVAREFGLSKQRVHQIVTGYRSASVKVLGAKKYRQLMSITKCQLCNKKRAKETHHIDKDSRNNSIENLIRVCGSCHTLTHRIERRQLAPKSCNSCGRLFSEESQKGRKKATRVNFSIALCITCKQIQNGLSSGHKLFYRKSCKLCGGRTKEGNRSHGYHIECWYKSDEYRVMNNIRHKLYFKERYKNDPQFKESQLAYNRKRYAEKKDLQSTKNL